MAIITLSPVGQLIPSCQLHEVWNVTPNTTAHSSRLAQRLDTRSAQNTMAACLVITGATLTCRMAEADRRRSNPLVWDI
jgi:hypothetical protein